MQFSKLDPQTGEFILAPINNLYLPKDLNRPEVNNSKKAVYTGMYRAPGWHYEVNQGRPVFSFFPAYNEQRGVKLPITITMSGKWLVVQVQNKSSAYKSSIPLFSFLKTCFPYASKDLLFSTIGLDKFIINPKLDYNSNDLILTKDALDPQLAVNQFRFTFTEQTRLADNSRTLELLSLYKFLGKTLAQDYRVYDGVILRGTVLTRDEVFRIEHSGISAVDILTEDKTRLTITLLPEVHLDLSPIRKSVTKGEKEAVIHAEQNGEPLTLNGVDLPVLYLPSTNTFNIYCLVANRVINFSKAGISIDPNEYGTQVLVSLQDSIDIFNSQDASMIEDRILTSDNYLQAMSGLLFDKDRLNKKISTDETSLVGLADCENAYTLVASSGDRRVVRPVKHLNKAAVMIQQDSFMYEDGVNVSEGSNIGKVVPLTATARLKNQLPYAPLYLVKDGEIVEEVMWINPQEAQKLAIAEFGSNLKSKRVLISHLGELKYVKPSEVTHIRTSPFSSTSYSRGTCVYAHHADPKRTQMGAKTAEQTRSILKPERPLVSAGVESLIFHDDVGFQGQQTVADIFADKISELLQREPSVHDMDMFMEGKKFSLSRLDNRGTHTVYKLTEINTPRLFATFTLENPVTPKGAIFMSDIIPPKEGKHYVGSDIVWRNLTVHNTEVSGNGIESLKFHSGGDPNFFKIGVGGGRNVRVMLGFYKSQNVDDASTVSDILVREMGYDTPRMIVKEYILSKRLETEEEIFGYGDGDIRPAGFTDNGLPKIGTKVYGGQPVMYKYTKVVGVGANAVREPNNFYMSYNESGEVISVEKTPYSIKITLYSLVTIQVGDKGSGPHGNKTIVCKILPQSEMPYDAKTGESVEWILNPISISGRMNIGQIPEMHAAAHQEKYGNGATRIEPLYEPVFEKYIRENKDIENITLRTMTDGATGQEFPFKMYVGNMYISRLVQQVDDKSHSVGNSEELDPAFFQPVGGDDARGRGSHPQRGQSVGAYEQEHLVTLMCPNILNEVNGLLSSDVRAYNDFIDEVAEQGLDYKPVSGGKPILHEHFHVYTEALYVKMEESENGTYPRFFSDKLIRSYQQLSVSNIINNLSDPMLCKGMSYFELSQAVITPIAISTFKFGHGMLIKRIASRVDGDPLYKYDAISPDFCVKLIERKTALKWVNMGEYSMLIESDRWEDDPFSKNGMEFIIELLRNNDIDFWRDQAERFKIGLERNESKKYADNLELYNRICRTLDAVESTGGMSQYITTCVPVMPLKYRRNSDSGKVAHDITTGYIKLANAQGSQYIYETLQTFLKGSDGKLKSVYGLFFHKNKNGRVRNATMKTRVKHSLRGNIGPAEYVHPDYIGLPYLQCVKEFEPYVCYEVRLAFSRLDKLTTVDGHKDNILLGELICSILSNPLHVAKTMSGGDIMTRRDINKLYALIRKASEGRYVFYNRAPALQPTSIWGGIVYCVKGTVIRIPTLVAKEQNADFDGDQEAVVAVMSKGSVEEIKTKLLPSVRLLRVNDGNPAVDINQDSLLGLYCATYEVGIDIMAVGSIEQVIEKWDLGYISPSQLVIVPFGKSVIMGSAGRIIVSNILNKQLGKEIEPGIFEPGYNKIIRGKGDTVDAISIVSLLKEVIKDSDSVAALNKINSLQTFGYESCYKRNLTLSLNDFEPYLEITKIGESLTEELEKTLDMGDLGLLPNGWEYAIIAKVAKFKESLKIKELLPKDNAFSIMINSGAQGKEAALTNIFGLIGAVSGPNGRVTIPILNSYIGGLSQFQAELMSYDQRRNAFSTAIETTGPGTLFRDLSHSLSAVKVVPSIHSNEEQINFYEFNNSPEWEILKKDLTYTKDFSKSFYKTEPLTNKLISQLIKFPGSRLELDNGEILILKRELELQYKSAMDSILSSEDKETLKNSVKANKNTASIKSFINCLSLDSGIYQDHLGVNPTTGKFYDVGEILGSRASSSVAQVGSQMVISRRNLVADGKSYNALGLFQDAVKNGKMFGEDFNAIAYVAPYDGKILISKHGDGTTLKLISTEGRVTTLWDIPVELEESRHFYAENEDYVFEGQILSAPKEDEQAWLRENKEPWSPHFAVHPIKSYSGSKTISDGMLIKNGVANPKGGLIQRIRYSYFRYLYDLYRSTISLDPMHFGCMALQQLRTATIIESEVSFLKAGTKKPLSSVLQFDSINFSLELLNGRNTTLYTAGPITSYVHAHALDGVSRAFRNGPIKENGFISKLALGIPQSEDGELLSYYNSKKDSKLISYEENSTGRLQTNVVVVEEEIELEERDADNFWGEFLDNEQGASREAFDNEEPQSIDAEEKIFIAKEVVPFKRVGVFTEG